MTTWTIPQSPELARAGCVVRCTTYASKPGACRPFVRHVLSGTGLVQLTPGSYLLIHDSFLSPELANAISQELMERDHLFERPLIRTPAGKTVPIPRGQTAFGQGTYHYSNIYVRAHDPPPGIATLLRVIQQAMECDAFRFVLVNKYTDGRDSIGRHADDERGLVDGEPIISYSLGAARRFIIRSKQVTSVAPAKCVREQIACTQYSGPYPINSIFTAGTCPGVPGDIPYTKWTFEIGVGNNVLVAMGGRFQQEFVHEVPVQSKVEGTRYNLTVRATTDSQ